MEMSKRFVLTLIRNEPTRRTTKKTDEQQCRRYHIHLDDLFDFFSSFLLGLVEGERDELDEPLRAGDACFCFDVFSPSDSDCDEELEDLELDDDDDVEDDVDPLDGERERCLTCFWIDD